MAKTKAVTDEELLAALMQHSTVAEAAAAAGISTRSFYDRMRTDDFQALYTAARTEVFRTAVLNINNRLSEAVDAVADIMTDEDTNPAVRLQAAQTIISNAAKFADRLTVEEQRTKNLLDPNKGLLDLNRSAFLGGLLD